MKLVVRILLAVAAIVVVWQGAHAIHAAQYEYAALHLPPSHPFPPPDSLALGLRDVAFPSAAGSTIRGWSIPSRTGAIVILASGSSSDRRSMLPLARVLSRAGLGVLLFDWPGCGESDGRVGLGADEVAALRGAVAYAVRRPDLQDGRLGVVGFSMGAWLSLLEAADDPRIRSVVLEGVYDEPWEQSRLEYRDAGFAVQAGAALGLYLGGLRWDEPRATASVARLAPRPVLMVSGSQDRTVPPALSRRVFEAARSPKEWWAIPGAGHGGYLAADPTYGTRIAAFLTRTLAAHTESTPHS